MDPKHVTCIKDCSVFTIIIIMRPSCGIHKQLQHEKKVSNICPLLLIAAPMVSVLELI